MDVMKVGCEDKPSETYWDFLFGVSLFTQFPLMTAGYCECVLGHLKLLFPCKEMRYLKAAGSVLVCRTSTICITSTLSLVVCRVSYLTQNALLLLLMVVHKYSKISVYVLQKQHLKDYIFRSYLSVVFAVL